jgi:hypothetical protein
MEAAEIVSRACAIFASDLWWRPITRFMIANCARFSGKFFKNDENNCFLCFRELFTNTFDFSVCKRIGVKFVALERAFGEAAASGNEQAIIVLDLCRTYTDFAYFRNAMIAMREKVEQMTADCMIEARRNLNEDDALDVVALLEVHEQQLLETETKTKCAEYQQLLKVGRDSLRRAKPPLPPSAPSPPGSFSAFRRRIPLKP